MAKDSIDSGKALQKLDKLVDLTRQYRPFIRSEGSFAA
jgi:hypothetical protein